MIVFKTFFKILNKCKLPIILYTIMLIVFGGLNMKTSENSLNFTFTKPDVFIINYDNPKGVTENLIKYISKTSNIKKIENNENKINDAIFYREVNYVIYIPKNYRNDFLKGKNPKIKVKSTGDYNASLAKMNLKKYIDISNTYLSLSNSEQEIIKNINKVLDINADVKMTSKLDMDSLNKSTFYFNFMNYSILAGAIYVICLVLLSFQEEKVKKRTIISSYDYKKHNRILLLCNFIFAFVLWLFYIILSYIICGKIMLSSSGLIYIINSLIFTFCAVALAFLLSTIINNKDAINGIVNIVSLGSSFLCGAFVPTDYLPDFVLKMAHILPSYYFINSNELVKKIEIFNFENLKPIFLNILIILLFSIGFIILNNFISRKKQIENS